MNDKAKKDRMIFASWPIIIMRKCLCWCMCIEFWNICKRPQKQLNIENLYANSCPHALLPIALSRTMGIAIKNERQSKEGSDDIRFMTYHHNEKMPVLVYVYWVLKHLQASIEILDYILAVLWIIKCNVWAVRRVLHFWSMYLTDRG